MTIVTIILLICAAGGLACSIAATMKMFRAFGDDFPVEERAAHIKKYRRRMMIYYGVTVGLITAAVAIKLLVK